MKRKAFSLIELLLAIVVLGILATYSTQMLNRDTRTEAMNHILAMIRYTQNLALHDKKHDRNNAYWQRSFWRIEFWGCRNGTGLYYKIGTDADYSGGTDGISEDEVAIDPSNGKYLYWTGLTECLKSTDDPLKQDVSPNVFLTQRYGIDRVEFIDCDIQKDGSRISDDGHHIGFDNFGRPIKANYSTTAPDYSGHMVGDCKIKFSFTDSSIDPFTIVVKAESGYAYIKEKPNL